MFKALSTLAMLIVAVIEGLQAMILPLLSAGAHGANALDQTAAKLEKDAIFTNEKEDHARELDRAAWETKLIPR